MDRPEKSKKVKRPYTQQEVFGEPPLLEGFHNPSDYCFIDSVLLAMLGPHILYTNESANPYSIAKYAFGAESVQTTFYKVLIETLLFDRLALEETIVPACNIDPDFDMSIRLEIQEQLRVDYKSLVMGDRVQCSLLRETLGKLCRLNKDIDEDFFTGQHDVFDLYTRLLRVFKYNPMAFRKETYFGYVKSKSEWKTVGKSLPDKFNQIIPSPEFLFQLNDYYRTNQDPADKQWNVAEKAWCGKNWIRPYRKAPEYFNSVKKEENKYNTQVERMYFDRVDCFVIHVMRGDPANGSSFERPVNFPDEVDLSVLDIKYNVPFAFETLVKTKPNSSVTDMRRKSQTYKLLSTIQHSGASINFAHYTNMLLTPSFNSEEEVYTWYKYDDLQGKRRVDEADAKEQISKRAVILFYFPWGKIN